MPGTALSTFVDSLDCFTYFSRNHEEGFVNVSVLQEMKLSLGEVKEISRDMQRVSGTTCI